MATTIPLQPIIAVRLKVFIHSSFLDFSITNMLVRSLRLKPGSQGWYKPWLVILQLIQGLSNLQELPYMQKRWQWLFLSDAYYQSSCPKICILLWLQDLMLRHIWPLLWLCNRSEAYKDVMILIPLLPAFKGIRYTPGYNLAEYDDDNFKYMSYFVRCDWTMWFNW